MIPEGFTKNEHGELVDANGTVFGVCILSTTDDPIIRLGIGKIFSFPVDHCLTRAAIGHDNKYTNPTYQRFHTRSEADLDFYRDLRILGADVVTAQALYMTVRLMGGFFWENDSTRGK